MSRQGWLLSPFLFNLLLEKIMQETLHDHHTSISIGGKLMRHLRFADDTDLIGGNNDELQDHASRLVDRTTACGIEVSTEKSKITTNSTNNISANIGMNGQKCEEVTSFKYLGATQCKDVICSAEVRIRIASTMAAIARLKRIWRCNTISFASKSPPSSSTADKHGPCFTAVEEDVGGKRLAELELACKADSIAPPDPV